MDQNKIQRMTSNKGVGLNFGGNFESLIKSANSAMFAELVDAQVNDEKVETVFIRVESMLVTNSRRLTTVIDDPNDYRVLTGI